MSNFIIVQDIGFEINVHDRVRKCLHHTPKYIEGIGSLKNIKFSIQKPLKVQRKHIWKSSQDHPHEWTLVYSKHHEIECRRDQVSFQLYPFNGLLFHKTEDNLIEMLISDTNVDLWTAYYY